MKTKLFFAALLCFLCNIASAQKVKPEPIYSVIIYVWGEHENGIDSYQSVLQINADGSVVNNDEPGEESFNMKKVEKAFFSFINNNKVPKTPAYSEDEIPGAVEPDPGKQVLHITVITVKDNNEKGDNYYAAEYYIPITADYNDTAPKQLFGEFGSKEQKLLGKYLYPEKK